MRTNDLQTLTDYYYSRIRILSVSDWLDLNEIITRIQLLIP